MYDNDLNQIKSLELTKLYESLNSIGIKIVQNRLNPELADLGKAAIKELVEFFSRFKENDFLHYYPDLSEESNIERYFKSDFGYYEGSYSSFEISYLDQPLILAKHLKINNVVTQPSDLEFEKNTYRNIIPDEMLDVLYGMEPLSSLNQLKEYHDKLDDIYKNLPTDGSVNPFDYRELIMFYLDQQYERISVDSTDESLQGVSLFELSRTQVAAKANRDQIFEDLITRFFSSLKVHHGDAIEILSWLLNWWDNGINTHLFDEEFLKKHIKDYLFTDDKTFDLGLLELGVYDALKEMVKDF